MHFKLVYKVVDFPLKLLKSWNSPSVRPIMRPVRQVKSSKILLLDFLHRLMYS
jgi:hypothetical protein